MHFHKLKNESGYTVVELLAVVAILVIVTGVISALISQTLRGSNKSNITNQVAQAGNYASSLISSSVIKAQDVVAVDGVPVENCTENPTGSSIELQMSDDPNDTILYACTSVDDTDTIASNSASLIDSSRLRASPDACYFTCLQEFNDPYTPPIIEFGFTITQASDNPLFENQNSAPFETSVLMRNYRPQ